MALLQKGKVDMKKKSIVGWTIINLWQNDFTNEGLDMEFPHITTRKKYMGQQSVKVRITIKEIK